MVINAVLSLGCSPVSFMSEIVVGVLLNLSCVRACMRACVCMRVIYYT